MNQSQSDASRDPEFAMDTFAAFVAERRPASRADFDPLLLAHPELEKELEELIGDWMSGMAALRGGASTLPVPGPPGADVEIAGEPDAPRYTVGEEFARGAMGSIRRVRDEQLERDLAMKILLRDGTEADARRKARFVEEARITGQLDHPGVVPVHELGVDAVGHVFFTMKLVRGETLQVVFERFEEGDPDWSLARVLGVLSKVCEAMSYAHAKGVIHRDLKPANIMVGRFGEVFVMDWGLARVLGRKDVKNIRLRVDDFATRQLRSPRREGESATGDESPLVTMDGDVVGTPAYMPPEQAYGNVEELGPAADVYAMGAMLYHLLAGHAPYFDRPPTPGPYELLARICEGRPRALSDGPAELVSICERAMAREPGARYSGMAELARDLRAYLEGRVVRAHGTGAIVELRKWVARNRAVSALAATVLVALPFVGVLATYYLTTRDEVAAAEHRAHADLVESLLQRGELELEELRYAEAKATFVQALDHEGSNPTALIGLVVAHQRSRDHEAALAALDAHGAIVAEYPALELLRAESLRRRGDPDRAKAIEDAIPLAHNHVALHVIGSSRLKLARATDHAAVERALDPLLRAIVLAPRAQPRYHYLALEAAVRAGNTERARELIRATLQLWPEAPATAYRVAKAVARCRDFDPEFDLADDLRHAHYEQALAAIRRAAEAPQARWIDLAMLAAVLRIEGDLEGTIAARRRMTELGHRPEDHYNLANALKDVGDYEGAIEHYRTAAQLRPSYLKARGNLATLLGDMGDPKGALAEFVELEKLAPDHPVSPYNQGEMLKRLGRFEESVAAFERSAELNERSSRRYPLHTDNRIAEVREMIASSGCEERLREGGWQSESAEQLMSYTAYCHYRRHHQLGAELFEALHARDPEAAADHAWNGAFAAAQVAAGRAGEVDDEERRRWRRKALEWLAVSFDGVEREVQAGERTASSARRTVFRTRQHRGFAELLDPDAAGLASDEIERIGAVQARLGGFLERVQ
ncbi:MAG: protein kinase [bacterium]|nr:protein kinase [bacterium]